MQNKLVTILHRITVALFLIIALFPIYWMLNTSLKTQGEVIYCKIETDKVAKKIPQFCNYEFPTIAKGH